MGTQLTRVCLPEKRLDWIIPLAGVRGWHAIKCSGGRGAVWPRITSGPHLMVECMGGGPQGHDYAPLG